MVVYFCDSCPFTTNRLQKLNIHISAKHTTTREFKCDQCGKYYKADYTRKAHIRLVHERHDWPRPPRVACDLCDSTFSRKHDLTDHVNIVHKQMRNFPCEIVSKLKCFVFMFFISHLVVSVQLEIHPCLGAEGAYSAGPQKREKFFLYALWDVLLSQT